MIAEEDMLIRGTEDELSKAQAEYDEMLNKLLVRHLFPQFAVLKHLFESLYYYLSYS